MIADDTPLLDPAVLDELNVVFGPHGVARLTNLLIQDLRIVPDLIDRYVSSNALSDARDAAHALKGAALGVGATAVAAAADQVERAPDGALAESVADLARWAAATDAMIQGQNQHALSALALKSFERMSEPGKLKDTGNDWNWVTAAPVI